MGFDRRVPAVGPVAGHALGLIGCGMAGQFAVAAGYWGLLAGAVLAAFGLVVAGLRFVARLAAAPELAAEPVADIALDRLILDGAPVPMVDIAAGQVRALNRAARQLFGADERILPVPADLLDPAAHHVRYAGRQWRIDRVELGGARPGRTVASLIDVEQEAQAAEARASSEMIHVLGHELLNGLAPIVSLAESGEAVLDAGGADPALLREILTTLGRRAESLQRFTEAYRELARLPPPRPEPVPVAELAGDMARLFASRWPEVALAVTAAGEGVWPLDRDQIGQALWALLQNAAEAATAARGRDAQVRLMLRRDPASLAITVEDNGPGVAPEQAGRIFRPFQTSKADGTGVGLSLARQIAQAHGGTLTVRPGPSALFTLQLPRPSQP